MKASLINKIKGKVISNDKAFGIVSDELVENKGYHITTQKNTIRITSMSQDVNGDVTGMIIREKEESIKLIINPYNRAVKAIVNKDYYTGEGLAKCCPEDKFDNNTGIEIAVKRAEIDLLSKQLEDLYE